MNAITNRNATITIIAMTTTLLQLDLSSIDFATLGLERVYVEQPPILSFSVSDFSSATFRSDLSDLCVIIGH
jgi:hypothetical protein